MFTCNIDLFESAYEKIASALTEMNAIKAVADEVVNLSQGLEIDISSVANDINDSGLMLVDLYEKARGTLNMIYGIYNDPTMESSMMSGNADEFAELLLPTSPFASEVDGEYGAAQAGPYNLFEKYMASKGHDDLDVEDAFDDEDEDEWLEGGFGFGSSDDFDEEAEDDLDSIEGIDEWSIGTEDEYDDEDDDLDSDEGFPGMGPISPPFGGIPDNTLTETEEQQVQDIIKLFNEKGITDEAIMLEILEYTKGQACGQTVITNWVAEMYTDDPDAFEKKYGYPLFVEKDGRMTYNYETLLTDVYLDSNEKFLSDNVTSDGFVPNNNDSSVHPDEMGDKMAHFLGEDIDVVVVQHDATTETYKKYKEEGYDYAAIAGYRYDMNARGSNEYGDYIGDKDTEDGHWMTITGITENNKFELSSWGSDYELEHTDLYARFLVDGVQLEDRDDECIVFVRRK